MSDLPSHGPLPSRLRLPPRTHVARAGDDDPLPFYYVPVVGYFYRARLELLLEFVARSKRESILEVACGSGIMLPSLGLLCDRIYGLDLHGSLPQVQRTLAREGVCGHLIGGSALALPVRSGSLDCVVSASMLEHLTDPGAAIDEMLRVLRPGGLLVAGFPVRNFAMDRFFQIVGYSVEHLHPSSHRDILLALAARKRPTEVRTFPGWMPEDLSLYVGVSVTA
jgi:SAM-dependent methyltransferase